MKRRILNKLARNKIHENLASNGKGEIAITRILSDEEYFLALRDKLQEEVAEFLAEPITDELADILQVIHSLAPLVSGSFEELEKARLAKEELRGGHDKKIFLEEIRSIESQ